MIIGVRGKHNQLYRGNGVVPSEGCIFHLLRSVVHRLARYVSNIITRFTFKIRSSGCDLQNRGVSTLVVLYFNWIASLATLCELERIARIKREAQLQRCRPRQPYSISRSSIILSYLLHTEKRWLSHTRKTVLEESFGMGATFSQLFPPSPDLTEKNLPSQKGKVFIVTGGTSGVGFELARILYQAGAKVYVAGRSEPNAKASIEKIKSAVHDASGVGQLEYLYLELNDLSTIKTSAEAFQKRESKLDVLWNNAGVSQPPVGSKSKQSYELQMATNCLGHLLFTQLLLPSLKAAATASNVEAGTVRVVWTSSQVVDLQAPPEGITMSEIDSPPSDQMKNYNASKVGNWFLASEFGESSHS